MGPDRNRDIRTEEPALWRGDMGYEEARRGAVWSDRKPDRFPDLIVPATSDEDVVAAVGYARSHGMKVAVRGGGHSFCGSPVREGGVLIDLSRLRAVSVDPTAHTVSVQPGVTGGELARALAQHGLAFPVGHCASVPMSGYLLSGGLGWNIGSWGPACFSIERLEVVKASGQMVSVDDQHEPDLFWAARGAGPGFFGVATRFQLAAYPLPRAIRSSTYIYPLSEVEQVSRWAEQLALPSTMEMVLVLASAPPGAPAGPAGKVVAITAAAFAETEADAAEQLSVLESCPALERSVVRHANQASSFETLQEAIGMLLPEGRRYAADSPWLSEGIGSLLPRLAEELVTAPSAQSVIMAPLLSPMRPGAAPPDAAFSKVDRTILPCYAIWDDEADDDANEQWLRRTVARVEPSVTGHYIAEADLTAGPGKSTTAYAPANWERLAALKRKLDPDDVFHTFLGQ